MACRNLQSTENRIMILHLTNLTNHVRVNMLNGDFIYQPATIHHAHPPTWYLLSSLPMSFHKLSIYLLRHGQKSKRIRSRNIIKGQNEPGIMDVVYTSSQTLKIILLLNSVANVCYIGKQVKRADKNC